MAGGLVGLFDDMRRSRSSRPRPWTTSAPPLAARARKLPASSWRHHPAYVHGLAAERELPIIKRIATGSLRSKLLFILPVALELSQVAPVAVETILMVGGTHRCYEGGHRIVHACSGDDDYGLPAAAGGPDTESATVTGAIRSDVICRRRSWSSRSRRCSTSRSLRVARSWPSSRS